MNKRFLLPFLLIGLFTFLILGYSSVQAEEIVLTGGNGSTTESYVDENNLAVSAIGHPENDVTRPEQSVEKQKILSLFENRPADNPSVLNFFAYVIQRSVKGGVPANIMVLLLLVPFLATLYAFFHHIVGLASLDMLTSIILSVTLLATGILPGIILLTLLFAAAFITHIIVKRIRIMHIPKMALSLFLVSMIVLAELISSVYLKLSLINDLSIFPLIIFVLLSDSIVSLYLNRPVYGALMITVNTIFFGVVGYFIMTSESIRNTILLYPELVLLTIPINIAIGRFFGLRLTERSRFADLLKKTDISQISK